MLTITGIVRYPEGLPRKEWPLKFGVSERQEDDTRQAQIKRANAKHYEKAAAAGLCKMCRIRPGERGPDVRDKGLTCNPCKEASREKRAKNKREGKPVAPQMSRSEYERKRRDDALAKGNCGCCRTRPRREGKKTCFECSAAAGKRRKRSAFNQDVQTTTTYMEAKCEPSY